MVFNVLTTLQESNLGIVGDGEKLCCGCNVPVAHLTFTV